MDYLKIPLDLSVALKGTLARCSPEESIAQNIMLLIVSHPGEIFGKYEYGSIIWELEFNQLVKVRDWEETVRNSLVQSITAYERDVYKRQRFACGVDAVHSPDHKAEFFHFFRRGPADFVGAAEHPGAVSYTHLGVTSEEIDSIIRKLTD